MHDKKSDLIEFQEPICNLINGGPKGPRIDPIVESRYIEPVYIPTEIEKTTILDYK